MKTSIRLVALALSIRSAVPSAASDSNSPSVIGARSQTAFSQAEHVTEQTIRLTGTVRNDASRDGSPSPVVSVSIPDSINGESRPITPSDVGPIPAGARWPDAHARISIGRTLTGIVREGERIRNPWEVRSAADKPEEETPITCGGTLVGGLGSSVAFLNGGAVREGEVFGKFRVVRILATEVVLEGDGCFVVIPRGLRVTVANAGN